MRTSFLSDFRSTISRIFIDRFPAFMSVVSSTAITSIFSAFSSHCHVQCLSLTGDMDMFENMMHFILQRHDQFPALSEIYYHCSPPPEHSTFYTYYYIPTSFPPPVNPPASNRTIAIFIYIPVLGSRRTVVYTRRFFVQWNLSSPSLSKVIRNF